MKKALWLVLLITGCGLDRVTSLEEDFFVEQRRIELGVVYVGQPREVRVPVESRSRYAMTLTANGGELMVPAGGVAELSVTVERAEAGAFEQVVLISGERQQVEVTLVGTGVVVPECVSRTGCVRAFFDFEAGACAEEHLPEDTACGGESACVSNGHCEAGECRGEAVSCDDGNACTDDACSLGQGCIHVDASARCEATSACVAGFCDPLTGCKTTEVEDGVACGPSDCATAHVCMSGACVERPVPEGASCGGGSPCQGAGQCVQGACVQPPAGVMQPVWSYTSALPKTIQSSLLMDESGNLVFVECGDGSCELVSVTPASSPRFRVGMAGMGYVRAMSIARGRVFVASDKGDIRIHSAVTGARISTVDIFSLVQTSLLPMPGSPSSSETNVSAIAADGGGRLYAIASVHSFSGDSVANRGSFLLALDDATGSLLWKRRATHFSRLVVSEAGRLFTSEWPVGTTSSARLIALDSAGVELFAVSNSDAPIATAGGQMLTSYGTLRSTSGGTESGTAIFGQGSDWVLLKNSVVWAVAMYDCFPAQPALLRYAPTAGGERLEVVLDGSLDMYVPSAPLLTQADSVLVMVAGNSGDMLKEVSAQGAVSFSCQLGGMTAPSSALLGVERYFVRDEDYTTQPPYKTSIRAYDLPGRVPAVSGWIGPGGGPQHSSRPR